MEEERRLFYVALTRAKKQVILTYTRCRYRWGKLNDAEPSRFLSEIEPSCVDNRVVETNYEFKPLVDTSIFGDNKAKIRMKQPPTKKNKPIPKNPRAISSSSSTSKIDLTHIIVGARVEHNRFGVGTIVSIEGDDCDAKALVDFDGNGKKNLLLRFAKLDIL